MKKAALPLEHFPKPSHPSTQPHSFSEKKRASNPSPWRLAAVAGDGCASGCWAAPAMCEQVWALRRLCVHPPATVRMGAGLLPPASHPPISHLWLWLHFD
jgi:hypothetical protein